MKPSDLTNEQVDKLEKQYKRAKKKFFKGKTLSGLELCNFKNEWLKKKGIEL